MSETRRVLVVEDGEEYTMAFRRLAPREGGLEIVRAGDLDEARQRLRERRPDALFLDVVFDRTPEPRLAGDLDALTDRLGGDRSRAVRQLAESQGFYVLDALALELPADLRVVLAYDFTAEPRRLDALRRRVPGLVGLPDGVSLTRALGLLLGD